MKVKEVIRFLSYYDGEKEVFFMKEHESDDIVNADEIHEVTQRKLTRNDFESSEFIAVIFVHHKQSTPAKAEGKELPSDDEIIKAAKNYIKRLKISPAYKYEKKNWFIPDFIEGAKWMRSQLQSLPKEPLRDELIKFAEHITDANFPCTIAHGEKEPFITHARDYTCEYIVDEYLNSKEK